MSSSINIDKSEVGVLEKENFVALNESSEKSVVVDRTLDVNHVEPRVVQSGGGSAVASDDLKTNEPININLLDDENNQEIENNSYNFSNFL